MFDAFVIRLTRAYLQLRAWFQNTMELPHFARLVCDGGMFLGPIALVAALVLFHDWVVNGQRMSYGEFWRSGAGLSVVTFAGLISAGSWGIAARRPWSRWAIVATPVLPIVPFPRSLIPGIWPIINGVLTAAVLYLYLFHAKSIRTYMAGPSK
jgi:hypothetical protein